MQTSLKTSKKFTSVVGNINEKIKYVLQPDLKYPWVSFTLQIVPKGTPMTLVYLD